MYHGMYGPLAKKLNRHVPLSPADSHALSLISSRIRRFTARTEVLADGDRPDHIHLILGGWACRTKTIASSGARQITAFLLPGDMSDLDTTMLGTMDHAIEAISTIDVAIIDRADLAEIVAERPNILQAMRWSTLVDGGTLRAWIVNNGRRSASSRVAHLLCELRERLENVGLATDDSFSAPLSQADIADAAGLTAVHVNRVVKQFRLDGVLTMAKRHVLIHDMPALTSIAEYDSSYLHAVQRQPFLFT